jgi:DNA repair protein RecO (recombination protein O)
VSPRTSFVKVAADVGGWYLHERRLVPTEIVTPAFVLRARPYGESDRIVTLLTELHGKVTGIAKGAKNSRRRFAGTLEPFVHIRAAFHVRPHADLVFLLHCELLRSLRTFTRDLDRFAAGSYVLDLTDRMVLGRESGRETYALVHDTLGLLDTGSPPEPLLRAFELHLLAASGYAPALDRCGGCAAPADGATRYLSVARMGLLCRACVPAGEPVRPVRDATARALAALATAPLGDATRVATPGTLPEAAAVAEHLLAAVTSGPVRSRAFLARTRVDSPNGLR